MGANAIHRRCAVGEGRVAIDVVALAYVEMFTVLFQ